MFDKQHELALDKFHQGVQLLDVGIAFFETDGQLSKEELAQIAEERRIASKSLQRLLEVLYQHHKK